MPSVSRWPGIYINPMDRVSYVLSWSAFLEKIRSFLRNQAFYEVTTSHLVEAGAFENTIDTLKVSFSGGYGELHSSPELEMKILLAKTRVPIFQICQCFRDDQPSKTHSREFSMLEFYRPEGSFYTIIDDMKNLIGILSGQNTPFLEYSLRELVLEKTGIDLTQVPTQETFEKAISKKKLFSPSTGDSWNDLFFKLMLDYVETKLDPNKPTVVYHYPASLAALSHLNPEGFAERFEIYWKGMEICNGCTELTDYSELEKRLQEEKRLRLQQKKNAHPLPTGFIQCMKEGFPHSAGVAVGLKRLFKCLHPNFIELDCSASP